MLRKEDNIELYNSLKCGHLCFKPLYLLQNVTSDIMAYVTYELWWPHAKIILTYFMRRTESTWSLCTSESLVSSAWLMSAYTSTVYVQNIWRCALLLMLYLLANFDLLNISEVIYTCSICFCYHQLDCIMHCLPAAQYILDRSKWPNVVICLAY